MRLLARHWALLLGVILCGIFIIEVMQPNRLNATPGQRSFQGQTLEPPINIRLNFGRSAPFDCQIDGAGNRTEEIRFGYPSNPESIRFELDRRLKQRISDNAKEIDAQMEPYCHAVVEHDRLPFDPTFSMQWKPTVHFSDLGPPKNFEEACDKQKAWVGNNIKKIETDIYNKYLTERGFQRGAQVEISYKAIADRGRSLTADCYEKLFRVVGLGRDDDEIRDALLDTIRKLPRKDPLPLTEGKIYTAGFWIPTRVLQIGGDCDSKAAALCALWQNPGPQIALFRFIRLTGQPPQHMYLGVEGQPSSLIEDSVTVNGRTYILYETLDERATSHSEFQDFDHNPTGKFCMTSDCGF